MKLSFSSAWIISAVGMKDRKELTEKNRAEEWRGGERWSPENIGPLVQAS